MKEFVGVRLVDATHIDVALHPLSAANHYARLLEKLSAILYLLRISLKHDPTLLIQMFRLLRFVFFHSNLHRKLSERQLQRPHHTNSITGRIPSPMVIK